MSPLPVEVRLSLPPWLRNELPSLPTRIGDPAAQLDMCLALADRNWREGTGGPFAALVVDATSGEVRSAGVNLVLDSGLSAAHAEVVAISLAQAAAGTWNLGDGPPLALVVSWRPCVQCFGALLWSGITELRIAGQGDAVERLTGFDEGPMPADWRQHLESRGITVTVGPGEERAVETFRAFGASDAVVYNGGAGARDDERDPS